MTLIKTIKLAKYKKQYSEAYNETYRLQLFEDGDLEIEVYGSHEDSLSIIYLSKLMVEKLKSILHS